MKRKSLLLYISFGLMILVATLHFLANAFYFYWSYWWYDWMMHFLAGLAGGMAAYWGLFESGFWRRRGDKILLPILSVVVCLMIVGVAWEIFEFANGMTDSTEGYRLDTIHDLMMDAAGSLVAAIVCIRATLFKND